LLGVLSAAADDSGDIVSAPAATSAGSDLQRHLPARKIASESLDTPENMIEPLPCPHRVFLEPALKEHFSKLVTVVGTAAAYAAMSSSVRMAFALQRPPWMSQKDAVAALLTLGISFSCSQVEDRKDGSDPVGRGTEWAKSLSSSHDDHEKSKCWIMMHLGTRSTVDANRHEQPTTPPNQPKQPWMRLLYSSYSC
jgi:hypothetical protein